MALFCTCGSLLINDNCSNRKCSKHSKKSVVMANFKQTEYIKSLLYELEDDRDIDFSSLTSTEASDLINSLLELRDLKVENE